MKTFHKIIFGSLSAILTILGFGSCKTIKMAQHQRERQLLATIDSLEEVIEDQKRVIEYYLNMNSNRERQKTVYGGPNMMDRRVVVPDDSEK